MATIVIVEDDGALRNDMSDRLTDWGHDVIQAGDGLEGFQAIRDCRPALVLSAMLGEYPFIRKRRRSLKPLGS